MSDVAGTSKCVVCGHDLPAGQEGCAACGVSGPWQDLLAAARFAGDCFARWAKSGTIGESAGTSIAEEGQRQIDQWTAAAKQGRSVYDVLHVLHAMPSGVCWSCQRAISSPQAQCDFCGAPLTLPQVNELRYWLFASHQIKAHCDAGRLPLSQAHACMNLAKSQIAALRNQLEKDRVTIAEVVPEKEPQPAARSASQDARRYGRPTSSAVAGEMARPEPRPPRRPLLEIILDPRTIQWLLGLGGVLLVVGLVIWLAAVGVFENPVVVAVALAASTSPCWSAAGRSSDSHAIRRSVGSSRCWPAWSCP